MIDSNELTRKIKTPLNPKAAVNLMAANFALLIVHMMKSSTVSPMTKKMTRMNRRQMEHDGPRV